MKMQKLLYKMSLHKKNKKSSIIIKEDGSELSAGRKLKLYSHLFFQIKPLAIEFWEGETSNYPSFTEGKYMWP